MTGSGLYTFFSPGMRVTVFVCLTSSFWGVFCLLVFVSIFVSFSRSFVGLLINTGGAESLFVVVRLVFDSREQAYKLCRV